jgi:hypothetical protein
MKREYTAPTFVQAGDVVEQTRTGGMDAIEQEVPSGKNPLAGSVGYYL